MRKLTNTATAFRFLLGGIGTGNVSLDHNGRLCDFELFNHANKGLRGAHTFFAVRTADCDGNVNIRLLESQLVPPFNLSHGFTVWENAGLPRFERGEITSEYPFVHYDFSDPAMPISASLEAFSPFIPLNTDDSSLPVAMLRYRVRNASDTPLEVSVCGSMMNFACFSGFNVWRSHTFSGEQRNELCCINGAKGVRFLPANLTPTDLDYLETSLFCTSNDSVTCREMWNEGAWWDGLQDFWNEFEATGAVSDHPLAGEGSNLHKSLLKIGSVCAKKRVESGDEAVFEFVLSWYRPNRVRHWDQYTAEPRPLIKNYSARFGDSAEVSRYFIKNLSRLEGDSRKFNRALYGKSFPPHIADAIAATANVVRSQTCFRVEDGTFFGWEGTFPEQGSCYGNCTHVWNYTQLMAFMFPELERSMRETEFLTETDNDGRQYFRASRYLEGYPADWVPPAADGQLGTIVRLYRDWQLCGDDEFLRAMWQKAKPALDYAIKIWDTDGDGVMEQSQHNTYDIEFQGATTMTNTILLAALRAGEEISNHLGDTSSAERYAELFRKGSAELERLTWGGEYYIQNCIDAEKYKYQYSKGCLSDQLFGQQLAHVTGLGYLLNPNHVKSAVSAIYRYNMQYGFANRVNLQRTYTLNDDAGLINCSWPNGGRPAIPFIYSDEVWTGIEYQVASHLIYEGFVDEGLDVVAQVRGRHDGVKRNPWDEVECGHHYARSMASYSVLLALTGFRCDAVNKVLYFKPRLQGDFNAFFCCPDGWGVAKVCNGSIAIDVLHGDLSGYTLKSSLDQGVT